MLFFKLGYKDSNLEMTESESVALPFGDTPMKLTICIIWQNSEFVNKKMRKKEKKICSEFSIVFLTDRGQVCRNRI